MSRHVVKSISSSIDICGRPEQIWDAITNVKIEQFSDPFLFKLLDIPKPLRAELFADGVGGSRIAYFDTGKRFMQKILVWEPLRAYSFAFNPEPGFRVGYFFELSAGVFRMLSGSYLLVASATSVKLTLSTTYSLNRWFYALFNLPVRLILKLFQRYLLTAIKKTPPNGRH